MKMNRIWILIVLVLPAICLATVDRLEKTYQPLYCPQKGIQILPIHFRTWAASPEVEVGMICSTNALLRYNRTSGGGNANLASICGLTTKAVKVRHQGPVSVLIDMTNVSKPKRQFPSITEALQATIQCLVKLLREQKYTVLHVTITLPENVKRPDWEKMAKSYDLTEKTGQQPDAPYSQEAAPPEKR